MGLILCLVVKYGFYRRAPYGFFEILGLAVYVLAQLLIVSALMLLAEDAGAPSSIVTPVAGVKYVYSILAISQFFQARGVMDLLKAAAAITLSAALFVALSLGLQVEHRL